MPTPEEMKIGTDRPKMTPGRAALLVLMNRYVLPGYRLTLLEIQKLAYFLQLAGEPLRLEFNKQKYGPYTETLHHVLQRMEEHFISGDGDRSRQVSVVLAPEAVKEAEKYLENSQESQERFARVSRLIDGFETPYGMELLASVHWVTTCDTLQKQIDEDRAVELVHSWNEHKKKTFRADHIKTALKRLRQEDWI